MKLTRRVSEGFSRLPSLVYFIIHSLPIESWVVEDETSSG
jgi:hypothetical protein